METLNDLHKELALNVKRHTEIINKIHDLESVEKLPELKAKYEGKYFKYRNSFSCPQVESDYWFVYYFVRKIASRNDVLVTRIETDKNGIHLVSDERTSLSILRTEIDQKEYHEAFEKLLKTVAQLRADSYVTEI